jgi:mRNA-degrading endonuclease RelE of RelBE toxin-antitoxin system
VLRREVVEDELDFAPRAQLKATLRALERDPLAGKPLSRALAGCRSVRIGGSENRLVYRVRGTDPETALVEVLAIGKRRESEAYNVAVTRLGG